LLFLKNSFQRLLNKQGGKRATWEYPFAVAGVNITFMIMQMLDLQSSMWYFNLIYSAISFYYHVIKLKTFTANSLVIPVVDN
jgi:ELMO/CED-12 family